MPGSNEGNWDITSDSSSIEPLKRTISSAWLMVLTASYQLLILLQQNLVWSHAIISMWKCPCSEKIGMLCSRVRSQERLKRSMNVCQNNIFWTAELFLSKPDMIVHHREPEYQWKILLCYLQGQGHNESASNQYDCFYYISVLMQPNLTVSTTFVSLCNQT